MSKVWIATGLTLALAATSGCMRQVGGAEAAGRGQPSDEGRRQAKMEAAGKDMPRRRRQGR